MTAAPAGPVRAQGTTSGEPDVRRDRWTGEVIGELALGGAAEAVAAVDAAARADPDAFPADERSAVLARVSAALAVRADEFAALITAETGKPVTAARTEVARAVGTLAASAEEARRLPGERVPLEATAAGAGTLAVTVPVPRGVVAAVTPFNFPVNLVAHKVGPAIAAGCPVVLKPSDKAPLVAVRLVELFAEAGLPAGWLTLVHGPAEPVVGAWLEDDRVAVLNFTGSAAVGWSLKARSPRKVHILELGSATAMYVHRSADLDRAAADVVAAGYANSGQACISLQRLYVDAEVADDLLARVATTLREVPVGDPRDPATVVGPLVTLAAAERVAGRVQEAVAAGASVLVGSATPADVPDSGVLHPVLLADAPPGASVLREEVFGPVVTAVRVADAEEAVRAMNDSRFGLNASVYADDLGTALEVARTVEAGSVLVNVPPSFRADHMPYGGVKDSGQGREGVRYAVAELVDMKLIVLKA